MNVQQNSKTRVGGNTRLFNIAIILILIAGFVTPPSALAAPMSTTVATLGQLFLAFGQLLVDHFTTENLVDLFMEAGSAAR